jgi:hypothetical protein
MPFRPPERFAPLTFKCTQRDQARSYARMLDHSPTFVTRTLPSVLAI